MVLTLKNCNPHTSKTYILGKHMLIFSFVGDYLTVERPQQAINSQSDRMDGLVVAMADFHVQLNLINLIYKTEFQVTCAKHFKEIL